MESIKTGKYIELAYKIYSIGKDNEKVLNTRSSVDRPDRFVFWCRTRHPCGIL